VIKEQPVDATQRRADAATAGAAVGLRRQGVSI
jgi:hypothetical protein